MSRGVIKPGQQIQRREEEEAGPPGTKRLPVYAGCQGRTAKTRVQSQEAGGAGGVWRERAEAHGGEWIDAEGRGKAGVYGIGAESAPAILLV
jgi:hypothetical protein